jgi:hypothetical protein
MFSYSVELGLSGLTSHLNGRDSPLLVRSYASTPLLSGQSKAIHVEHSLVPSCACIRSGALVPLYDVGTTDSTVASIADVIPASTILM